MGLFLLGPLIGPVVGPIAGGFINECMCKIYIIGDNHESKKKLTAKLVYDWRYIFWFLAIMGGVVFLLMLVCLPETSAKILRKREKYKEKGYLDEDDDPQESILKSMARPFQFITKPVVILATTPYSMAYGFMYFVISSLPHQLALHYGFSSYQIGLAFLANGVGNALGALASGKMSDRALGKVVNPENRVPELRLRPMWIGILLLPAGQLIYGWCTQLNIHVMASLSGLFLCK